MKWTIGQIADALGASFAGGDGIASGYSIDSRTLRHGSVFFAVRAARDGHDFVKDAFAKGACAAVVAWDWSIPADLAGKALLRVGDPRQSLADLASAQRREWGGPLAAVTGSSGKTTVKEAVAALLASERRTAKTEGNRNNDLGVPLTLLGISEEDEAAVVEMGMNHAGEIRQLARIAEPNVGVVTNVSHAHVGAFDSIEGVALAKRELIEELGADGTAVLNADDQRVAAFGEVHSGTVLTYGVAAAADFQAVVVSSSGGRNRFLLRRSGKDTGLNFETSLPGVHNVSNLVGAIATASTFGIEPVDLVSVIARFQAGDHRGQITLLDGITLIDDSYNANPAAVEAMLRDLAERPAARRVAVLGEMRELGEMSEGLHRRVGEAAATAGVGLLIAVSGDAKRIGEAAVAAGMDVGQTLFFEDSAAAGEALPGLLREGDAVLIKGSRGVGLERAVECVTRAFDREAALTQGAE